MGPKGDRGEAGPPGRPGPKGEQGLKVSGLWSICQLPSYVASVSISYHFLRCYVGAFLGLSGPARPGRCRRTARSRRAAWISRSEGKSIRALFVHLSVLFPSYRATWARWAHADHQGQPGRRCTELEALTNTIIIATPINRQRFSTDARAQQGRPVHQGEPQRQVCPARRGRSGLVGPPDRQGSPERTARTGDKVQQGLQARQGSE